MGISIPDIQIKVQFQLWTSYSLVLKWSVIQTILKILAK